MIIAQKHARFILFPFLFIKVLCIQTPTTTTRARPTTTIKHGFRRRTKPISLLNRKRATSTTKVDHVPIQFPSFLISKNRANRVWRSTPGKVTGDSDQFGILFSLASWEKIMIIVEPIGFSSTCPSSLPTLSSWKFNLIDLVSDNFYLLWLWRSSRKRTHFFSLVYRVISYVSQTEVDHEEPTEDDTIHDNGRPLQRPLLSLQVLGGAWRVREEPLLDAATLPEELPVLSRARRGYFCTNPKRRFVRKG